MAAAFARAPHLAIAQAIAIGTHAHAELPPRVEWIESSHPFPDGRSEAAGNRAIAIAQSVHSGEALVILLSGGASALMASPIDGISLADKIETTRLMMASGADIHALNTVRRHLSKVKGGRLAAACVGTTITLAISDVVGDDLHAIGSGPGVPDPTTLGGRGGGARAIWRRRARPIASGAIVRAGRGAATLPDTPKPGHAVARASDGAGDRQPRRCHGRRAARRGRARATRRSCCASRSSARRETRRPWLDAALAALRGQSRARSCVISSGETTVRVTGTGTGRPQPGVRAGARRVAGVDARTRRWRASAPTASTARPASPAASSIRRRWRAPAARVCRAPDHYLAANDSFAFFAPLGDADSPRAHRHQRRRSTGTVD